MDYLFRSATIKKFISPFNKDDINKIKNKQFNPSTSKEGFLYLESLIENKFLFKYLRKVPLTYGEYKESYTMKTSEIIKDVTFLINLDKQILIIFSGKQESNFLNRRFIRNFGVLTSNFELDFFKILDYFNSSNYVIRSEQATIKGFVFKNLMIGTYICNINDVEIFKKILIKYNENIEKIKLSIEYYDGDVLKINFDKNGSFIFNKFSEKNKDILNFLAQ